MSAKNIRYLLMAGVLFVWGAIIYRVFIDGWGSSEQSLAGSSFKGKELNFKNDFFHLNADYPDPFQVEEYADTISGGSIPMSPATITASVSSEPVVISKPDLSFIQYKGMIYNADKNSKVALITFRGTDILVKEKDKREDFIFKKIEGERITLVIKGKSFVIDRN